MATSGKTGSSRSGFARVAQPGGVDVPFEVVDPDHGPVVDPGQRLGEVDPDEERARQPRAIRDGDRVDVVPGRAGIAPCLVEDRHDPAQVSARGDLGDDPAGRRVEGDLRGDHVGTDQPPVLDEGDPRLIA